MQTQFSVTLSVTPTPYRAPVLWADAPSELLPFDTARKSDAQEVLLQVFWDAYSGAGSLEHAYETVRSHPAMHDLPPPPSEWKYPRLTLAMPPYFDFGLERRWEGLPKPISALTGFARLYEALCADPEGLRFRQAVLRAVERIGFLHPHPVPPEKRFVVGSVVFYPEPPQDDLSGWLWATQAVRFWSQLLRHRGEPLRDTLQRLGQEAYRLRHEDGVQRWNEDWGKLLEPGDFSYVTYVPALELAARVMHLHGGRKYLNRARVCEYLREAGLRGMQIPGPLVYAGAPEGLASPIPAYIGAYHRALLELSRKTGPRACAHCGASFIPARSTARYCSGACRMAAHRSRERTNK